LCKFFIAENTMSGAFAIPRLDIAVNPPGSDPLSERDRVKDAVLRLPPGRRGGVADRDGLACTQIQGGITNRLYKVEFSGREGTSINTSINTSPLLVRVYGEGSEHFIDRNVDEAVFAELTSLGFGVDLIATLRDGRVEQFFEGGRTLEPRDLCEPKISRLIADKMCKMHALAVTSCIPPSSLDASSRENFVKRTRVSGAPVSSPPTPVLLGKLKEWHAIACGLAFDGTASADEKERGKAAQYAALPLERIGAELEATIEARVMAIPSPTVFCHNDLLAGNILVRGAGETDIVFVDVEYAAYNQRGFDIGNHFCEFSGFNYSEFEQKFPSKNVQMVFLKSYLARQREMDGKQGSGAAASSAGGGEEEEAELEALYRECNAYALASHLFWGLWAVIQGRNSAVDFDYLTYAKARFDAYFTQKAKVFGVEGEEVVT
jgi:thiamine kinase-like enzyme